LGKGTGRRKTAFSRKGLSLDDAPSRERRDRRNGKKKSGKLDFGSPSVDFSVLPFGVP